MTVTTAVLFFKLAALFHIHGGNGNEHVAVHNISVAVHRKTCVGVSVKGKAHGDVARLYRNSQEIPYGWNAAVVNIYSVRGCCV